MRGCGVGLVLLLLLGVVGYALFEIHGLRGEVASLRAEVRASRRGGGALHAPPPAPVIAPDLIATVRRAQEAARQGNYGQARQELDRLSRQVARTTAMAEKQKEVWRKRTASSQHALAQRGATASRTIEGLLGELGYGSPPPPAPAPHHR